MASDARAGALAGAGDARVSRVLCRADQFAEDHFLPPLRRLALAPCALAPKPEGQRVVGADGKDRRALVATRQDQPSLAATSLSRQTPEVGAECVSSARSDLSGGRRVKPASLPGWGESNEPLIDGRTRQETSKWSRALASTNQKQACHGTTQPTLGATLSGTAPTRSRNVPAYSRPHSEV